MFNKAKHLTFSLMIVLFGVFVFTNFSTKSSENGNADAIVGTWKSSSFDYNIELYKLNNEYQGKIVGVKKTKLSSKKLLDKLNPQRSLRGKPIIGMINITDFEYNQYDEIWEDGIFYNPSTGQTMKCTITMKDNSTLEVTGFLGFALTEVSMTWKKM
jgi:uncharacterized protein (DUF2147 family)